MTTCGETCELVPAAPRKNRSVLAKAKLAMAASSSTTTTGGHYMFLVALSLLSFAAYGQLSEQFYAAKCPSLDQIIKAEVDRTLSVDRRMGASLLRLFFHDCFVQGCDASVLLDDDAAKSITSEKTAGPNDKSLRGFDVIDRIKDQVEAACGVPGARVGVVSCADILALVTKQAVIYLAGQPGWAGWSLLLGRRDSTTANKDEANTVLPSPNSELPTLIEAFKNKNFTGRELVALSGAHTIGVAQCGNVDETQRQKCIDANNNNTFPLDDETPVDFDKGYYDNLLRDKGLLHSDRVLVDSNDLKLLVLQYARRKDLFFKDFANAMEKMSLMSVLTGTNGEIRLNCSRVNY
ncbi:hypothetical protein SORBI_3004G106000 [Sorghum bicolor]|uniref:Peroxidase n=2 Tax=Sorghum bicolor TaxID=4558 RepID=A0A1Z5RLS9_SORBI|nr:hypothetical protein SORBI_3004G106000 [Sorghum bicolor]